MAASTRGLAGVVEIGWSGAVAADLAVGAEVDVFHFDVADAGTHIMTTTGPTDVVLTLHGPNDHGAVITWDDDRGRGANARIVRKLAPATTGCPCVTRSRAGREPTPWRSSAARTENRANQSSVTCELRRSTASSSSTRS